MTDHAQRAMELFEQGYNCAQAVFAAFCDETGMDLDMALKLTSPLGGGIGRLREACGALTGLLLVVGCKAGYTDPLDMDAKTAHYTLVQAFANAFKAEHGSYLCRDLIGVEGPQSPVPEKRTAAYHARPCYRLVQRAAEMADAWLAGEFPPRQA